MFCSYARAAENGLPAFILLFYFYYITSLARARERVILGTKKLSARGNSEYVSSFLSVEKRRQKLLA